MTLTKQPFIPYRTEEERLQDKSFVRSIRLNKTELEDIKAAMKFLRQPKITTTIKQLMKMGLINVLHDEKTKLVLQQALDNQRRNDKTGVSESEIKNPKM